MNTSSLTPVSIPGMSSTLPTQHIVDLENLLGGQVSPKRTRAVLRAYAQAVNLSPLDDLLVGVGPSTAASAAFSLPKRSRLCIGRGRSGKAVADSADLALLGAVDVDFSAKHFSRVCIASGDHIFAPLAHEFSSRGIEATAVIGKGWLSYAMRRATSNRVLRLDVDAALLEVDPIVTLGQSWSQVAA